METKMSQKDFGEFLAAVVGQVMEKSGMTTVDRKHVMFPNGFQPGNNVEKKIEELTPSERTVEFFRALIRPSAAKYDVRALSEGTDSAGGFLVPEDFRAQVIMGVERINAVRNLCFVIPMSRDTLTVPTLTSKVTATWTGEAVAHTESTPGFGQILLVAHKLSLFSKLSEELMDDAAVAVQSLLVRLFSEAIRDNENAVFTVGSGVNRPVGMVTQLDGGAQEHTPVGGVGTSVPEDLLHLYYALPTQYRSNATWLMHNTTIEKVRKFRDESGGEVGTGRFMWSDGFGTTPPTLLGRPVQENNDIPTTRGAANRSVVVFGDFKNGYYIGDRKQMSVKVSTEASDGAGSSAFLQDQVWLKIAERIDGQVALEEAIVMMDEFDIA